jgi:glucosamine-6-phosphate deaminase
MITSQFDSLTVRQYSDRAAMGAAASVLAAECIRAACDDRGEARVIFACAPSQDEFLEALVKEQIDWARVVVFHMDEYSGLAADHPRSFRRYLREHLVERIPAPRAVHWIQAENDPMAECARYADLLFEKPVDLTCMGIGENGHLAFNDPPVADFKDPHLVKRVQLDDACKRQQVNDGCFPSVDAVPPFALTLTIPALIGARRISCVVPGVRKAGAVWDTLLGPVDASCPASILRGHPHAVLHLDADSASLLPKTP